MIGTKRLWPCTRAVRDGSVRDCSVSQRRIFKSLLQIVIHKWRGRGVPRWRCAFTIRRFRRHLTAVFRRAYTFKEKVDSALRPFYASGGEVRFQALRTPNEIYEPQLDPRGYPVYLSMA